MNARPGRHRLIVFTMLAAISGGLCAEEAVTAEKQKEKENAAKPLEHVALGLLVGPKSADTTRVLWRNGESLGGSLDGATDKEIRWATKLFASPVRLQDSFLERIDFSNPTAKSEAMEFRLSLLDGSHLVGNVSEITDKALIFQTRLGPLVTVGWEKILLLERASGGTTIWSGATTLPLKAKPQENDGNNIKWIQWYFEPSGRAASPSFNTKVQLQVDVPQQGLLDTTFTTSGVPSFVISVGATDKKDQTFTLETWEDELVLTNGNRFVSAGNRFTEKDRQVRLRFAWNGDERSSKIFGPDGSVWAELPPIPPPPAAISLMRTEELPLAEIDFVKPVLGTKIKKSKSRSKPSKISNTLVWQNKGNGMTVQRLSMSSWGGEPVPSAVDSRTVIETAAQHIAAEPIGKNGDALVVRFPTNETLEIPLASVQAIRWAREPNLGNDPAATAMWFAEGQFLRGKILEVKDSSAKIEAALAPEPITVGLETCRSIIFPDTLKESEKLKPEEQKKLLGRLDILNNNNKEVLHGTIKAEGGKLPLFLLQGALEALEPASPEKMTMTKATPDAGNFIERAPALLHVKSQETFPVQLVGLSKEAVEFNWSAAEKHVIPSSQLYALQFAGPRFAGEGFAAQGWHSVGSGKPTLKDQSVKLPPGAGITHPYALQGDEISFKMGRGENSGYGAIRVRLFTGGQDGKSGGTNFLIGDFGSTIYCGIERGEDGQFMNQTSVAHGGGEFDIRFKFSGDTIQLIVKGTSTTSVKRDAKSSKNGGSGITIETTGLWGNQVQDTTVSDFENTQSATFVAAPPTFDEDAKKEALLLPRVHRDSPPKQILIGRNGDLLRGEIESMTSTHLLFRAGLETFKVPMDRIASTVWVEKPDKKESKGDGATPAEQKDPTKEVVKEVPKGTQWLDLVNGGRIQLEPEAWNAEAVTGRNPLLGNCIIPMALINKITFTTPTPTSGYAALSGWKLVNTVDPVLPEDEASGASSPLLGKDAPEFSVPQLVLSVDGEDPEKKAKDETKNFILKDLKGKVVVLDFWATWCGPCVKSLPGLVETMKSFPEDKVAFLALNQGETKDQVKKFMEARGLKMPVGFDATQQIAKKYGVEGIPYTVVISKEGKIAFVKTGYTPDGEKEIAEAVQKALN